MKLKDVLVKHAQQGAPVDEKSMMANLLNVGNKYRNLGTAAKMEDSYIFRALQKATLSDYMARPDRQSFRSTKTSIQKVKPTPNVIKGKVNG